jgi:hypothetical protein
MATKTQPTADDVAFAAHLAETFAALASAERLRLLIRLTEPATAAELHGYYGGSIGSMRNKLWEMVQRRLVCRERTGRTAEYRYRLNERHPAILLLLGCLRAPVTRNGVVND